MKPPKARYSDQPAKKVKRAVKIPKVQDVRLPRKTKRSQVKQIRRFTHERVFRKYFLRSLAGSLVVLVLLVLSTMFTPLLSIDKITVTGNHRVSTKQILAALKHRIGTPLPMVSESDVASDLKGFKLIESIFLVSQPPHLLQVRVTERTPIAVVIRAGTPYLYDPAGVNLGPATGSEKVPTILVQDDPKISKNYSQAIDVLLALPAQLLKRVAYIQAKSRDNVTLQLRGYAAQTIIWGDATDSILKSKVLKALLLKTPPSVRATFDVSSPLTPSVIR